MYEIPDETDHRDSSIHNDVLLDSIERDMNKRFKQLAESAGWKEVAWGGGRGWCGDPNVSLETFAELIVQDTIQILNGLAIKGTDKNSAYHNHVIEQSIKAIKQNLA